ncbi:MAG: IclR family transcriptional regulator [Alphaproteobacteria bacterium]|nr:IclR family transcriptional regulator [Alphaproteobacteria bacterium]MDX5370726.1 IclR family transcriptional regulator [Alphaproteobacteria bacterium]MDX5465143.1 IclR family transcriptional regulator [Alphaproteobacteria bacterium]
MKAKTAASPVKTAARTLDIFEVFRTAGEPLSLTELSERINSPVSSCHALVKTLQARGYIYTLDQRRHIYPTKRLLEVATDIARRDPLVRKITPLMTALRDETGETVIMGKRQGDAIIYLDVIEGTHTIRYTAHPGETKPLHSSSIGKAMLSLLPDADMERLLGKRLSAPTPNTLTDLALLKADIAEGRARGCFITRGENVADVMALAIVRRIAGETLGFALAGPIARVEQNYDRYLSRVMAFGADLAALDETLSRVR